MPDRAVRRLTRRLLRRRDHLADRITAHRNHDLLPTTELWVTLVYLEDRIQGTYPRAYTTHLPTWLQRRAPGNHALGGHHPECPLCAAAQHRDERGQSR